MDVGQLFAEHHQALCRYLLRFTGDADAAADAAQEAFVRALERPPATGHARAWLYTVATNAAREVARTRQRRWRILLDAPDRAPLGDAPADPVTRLEGEERRRVVQQALLVLSSKERTAILMMQEGFTQREIAEAVGTTTGSVGKLIARTLKKLSDHLGLGAEELR